MKNITDIFKKKEMRLKLNFTLTKNINYLEWLMIHEGLSKKISNSAFNFLIKLQSRLEEDLNEK